MERVIRGGNTIKVYPGASVDKFDPMIRLLLAYNSNFLCVFDSDKAGTSAKKRYEDDFGPAVRGRVLTLADINGNWKNYTTEDLFSENDRMSVIHRGFPEEKTYSKSKFNTALTEAWILGADIEFDEMTLGNFKQFFDVIDKLLPDGMQQVFC